MGLSRSELFSKLGIIKVVDPITQAIYEQEEELNWRQNRDSAPHGKPWHSSFHASRFPGDNEKACGRKALYELSDFAPEKPTDPKVRAMGEVGKDIETQLVSLWEKAGILLSNSAESTVQTGFEVPSLWLTGNCDAIILPTGWGRPHAVEIKGKDPEVIRDMQLGRRSYDEEHRNQLLTYIALVNMISKDTWPDLDVCRDGTLYYVSRSRPRDTMEYFFELDNEFIDAGIEKLKEWKEAFKNDLLPPRPKEWRWTEPPCRFCPFKKEVCKPDYKDKIKYLRNSHGREFTRKVRGEYVYEEKRQALLDRWESD